MYEHTNFTTSWLPGVLMFIIQNCYVFRPHILAMVCTRRHFATNWQWNVCVSGCYTEDVYQINKSHSRSLWNSNSPPWVKSNFVQFLCVSPLHINTMNSIHCITTVVVDLSDWWLAKSLKIKIPVFRDRCCVSAWSDRRKNERKKKERKKCSITLMWKPQNSQDLMTHRNWIRLQNFNDGYFLVC